MSIVVSYIREFDDTSPDWPLAAEDKLLRLHREIGPLYKSQLWGIDNLDSLHSFFDTLRHQVVAENTEAAHYPNPLRANSIIGGFAQDMVVYFKRLEFYQRAKMWEMFEVRREKVFKIANNSLSTPPTVLSQLSKITHVPEPALMKNMKNNQNEFEKVLKLIHNLDIHGAINEIHRIYDESPAAKPSGALVLIFEALFYSSNTKRSLKVAERAIVTARNSHDIKTIIHVVTTIWQTLHLFPNTGIPTTIGTVKQLLEYLLKVSKQVSPSSRFEITVFEVTYLRKSGASLSVLAKKLAGLTKLYSSIKLDKQALLTFHCECYEVWSLYGKADLARSHLDILQTMGQDESTEFSPLTFIFQTSTLLEKGVEGNTNEAMAQLEKLKPSTNLVRLQLYKTTKLILTLISLTKSSNYHQASSVLAILKGIPGELCIMYQQAIKYAEIELLLAKGLNAEAYEQSISEYLASNNAKYHLYAAKSLFCFSESSMKVRHVEALEIARSCEDCNSVPIKIEAKIISALAHANSEDIDALREGCSLCDECIPRAYVAQRPRLIAEALVVKTICMLQLYYQKNASIQDVVKCYNFAQTEVVSMGSDLLPQTRQLQELYEDISRENTSSETLIRPTYFATKTSFISVSGENMELKRKPNHVERRASKRRRSLLMPL